MGMGGIRSESLCLFLPLSIASRTVVRMHYSLRHGGSRRRSHLEKGGLGASASPLTWHDET